MASSKEIAEEIAQLEAKAGPVVQQLEKKLTEFAGAVPPVAEEWIRAHVRTCVERNAEKINNGSPEALRELKENVAKVIAGLPALASETVTQTKNEWPHLDNSLANKDFLPREIPYFDMVFGRLIASVAPVLLSHELIKLGTASTGDWSRMSGTFRYAYNPGFDKKKLDSLTAYTNIFKQYHDVAKAIAEKRVALEKQKAVERYDGI